MSKLNKASLLNYPAHILKGLNLNVVITLSEKAIKDKNYAELKYLAENMDFPYILMHKAINELDIEAVEIIISATQNSDNEYTKKGKYIDKNMIKHLFDESDNFRSDMNPKEAKAKQSAILKVLLEARSVEDLTLAELQKLVDGISQEDFEEFCTSKEIDLTSDKFKELQIDYNTEGLTQALTLEGEKYIELIVRAMEFRAAHLGKDLTDSFKGLEDFHQATISPSINALTTNNTLPFYNTWIDDICPENTSYSDYMVVSD